MAQDDHRDTVRHSDRTRQGYRSLPTCGAHQVQRASRLARPVAAFATALARCLTRPLSSPICGRRCRLTAELAWAGEEALPVLMSATWTGYSRDAVMVPKAFQGVRNDVPEDE